MPAALNVTVAPQTFYVFSASSRSRTDFSSLMRTVVRFGYCSVGVLCAVTRADCGELVSPVRARCE